MYGPTSKCSRARQACAALALIASNQTREAVGHLRTAAPMVEMNRHVGISKSEPFLLSSSDRAIALLEPARTPAFVPLVPACFAELCAPLAKD